MLVTSNACRLLKSGINYQVARKGSISLSRTLSSGGAAPKVETIFWKSKNFRKTALVGSVPLSLLAFCGLDFVAPRDYPFADATENNDDTYWKYYAALKRNDQNSHVSSKRSPLSPTATFSSKDGKVDDNQQPQDQSDYQYRVVIIGGGLAGLHTALALSERLMSNNKSNNSLLASHQILVLDANQVGRSASGKSKGLAVPGIQVPEEDLALRCGPSLAKQVYELTYDALKRLRYDIVQKYNIDCDWVDAGLVEASLHDAPPDNNAPPEDEEEAGCRVLTASEVRDMLGQPKSSQLYRGGEYDPSCSGLDPLALTRGIAHVIEGQYGVRISERTKAISIDKVASNPTKVSDSRKDSCSYQYIVTTDSGAKIQCQHVVLCTGPELVSRKLSKRLSNAIVPIYTWMASTVPLGDQCPLQNNNPPNSPAPLCGDDYVCLNYWRRTDDGRLLFGSLADAFPTPKWLAEVRLRRAMGEVYPQLANVPFEHVWGGTLAFSRDAVPLIGRDEGYDDNNGTSSNPSQGGVWYATGFGGHGIVPTVMAGAVLADGILGIDDTTWRMFHRQFPPRYVFWPVSRMGAECILTIYNAFDWLHVKGVPVPQLPKPW